MGEKLESKSVEKTREAVEAVKKPLVVLWAELEEWQQDNHYIERGYRSASGSFAKSAASLGYLHNESVNIYSHLLGSLISAIGAVYCYTVLRPRSEYAGVEDVYVFACFFLGVVGCLGMSAAYHTIQNHSHSVATFGNKLDYLGIVSLIWGSFVPSIYYGFTCAPSLIKTYWTMITTIGLGCGIVSVDSKFRTAAWRPFRALMFVSMGLSAVIPVVHGVNIYGLERMTAMMGLPYVISQGVLYVLGAAIYAARIPERLSPGTFDIWGSSHQIFHLLVLMAAATHFVGLVKAFDFHQAGRLHNICGNVQL